MNRCQEIASKTGMPPICAACNMGPCPHYIAAPTPREAELLREVQVLRKSLEIALNHLEPLRRSYASRAIQKAIADL